MKLIELKLLKYLIHLKQTILTRPNSFLMMRSLTWNSINTSRIFLPLLLLKANKIELPSNNRKSCRQNKVFELEVLSDSPLKSLTLEIYKYTFFLRHHYCFTFFLSPQCNPFSIYVLFFLPRRREKKRSQQKKEGCNDL